jgi:hypothetical protein
MNKHLNKIVAEEMEKATKHMTSLLEDCHKSQFSKGEVIELFKYTWPDYCHKTYKNLNK